MALLFLLLLSAGVTACELELRAAAGLPVPLHPRLGVGFLRLRPPLPPGLGVRLRHRLEAGRLPLRNWILEPERREEREGLAATGVEPADVQAILAHAAWVEARLRENLPEAERAKLSLYRLELRWRPEGDGPVAALPGIAAPPSPLGGHRDFGDFAATTGLVGPGTLYQPGNRDGRFDATLPIFETPTGETLLFTGVERARAYGVDMDTAPPGLVATVHESPTTTEPRLLVVMRFHRGSWP